MTSAGRRAQGFYLTPYWLRRYGAAGAAKKMSAAHMNAVMIDIKDDWGQILYPSKVPLSQKVQRRLIRNPRALVKHFHEAGIYVIGRIVSFKDSRLPNVRPDLSVRVGRRARRLFRAGAGWIDAYSAEVRDYLIDIALELQDFGFDEVQFDYIRFPKGRMGKLGTWLHQANDSRNRAQLIAAFLERADRALQIPMSVDVYGLTTMVDGDPRRLGQTIEEMARYVEAISPMMYANGMTSYFKEQTITPWVYSIIHCGLWRARLKAPEVVLRPLLQAYPNNVPFFGPRFIADQVKAAHRAGADGFLFWNSTMRNGVAYRGLRQLGRQWLSQFAQDPNRYLARANRPGRWCRRQGNVFSSRQALAPRRPSIGVRPIGALARAARVTRLIAQPGRAVGDPRPQ